MYEPMRATVRWTRRLSPHFVRVAFGGEGLNRLVTPPAIYDQRIKILLPNDGHRLPDVSGENWHQDWLATPEDTRGVLRTYSIRAAFTEDPHLWVDFVAHDEGVAGPWSASDPVGDEVIIVGPTGGDPREGIEFDPQPRHQRLVIVGDESAVPAMLRIVEDLPPTAQGVVLCEVPSADDELSVQAPAGVNVQWLPRADGQQVGELLTPAVLSLVVQEGLAPQGDPEEPVGEIVWETPGFSATGEELTVHDPTGDTYFWIAGEASMVTGLRRALVRGHGIARSDVAFMGYWRRGVS